MICSFGVLSTHCFASFDEVLQTQFFKYASTQYPTFYLNSQSTFRTEQFLLGVNTYFETGSKGTWMIDPDPIRYNLFLDDEKKNFLWFGREHPLNLTRSVKVDAFSALGTLWAQDQMNALSPQVSGWIGFGIKQDLTKGWTWTAAYSPVFLPNFSPSLGFTDYGDLNSSRFTRPPPASVIIGNSRLPIRYKLQVGQLSELLLQNQFFTGISHDDSSVNMDAYFYTAPRPNALPITTSVLSVNSSVVNAKVDIKPQFPREHWVGTRAQIKEVLFQPAFEFVQGLHEWTEHYASLTGYFDMPRINPNVVRHSTRASFGTVTHFQKQFEDPQFSDLMVFIKIPVDLTDELAFRNVWEQTFLNGRKSFYWMGELEYTFSPLLSVVANVRLLAGEDYSYFGDWRAEDSAGIGTRWIW